MNNIAVCIPTYKRQSLLQQLVTTIFKCKIDTSLISLVNIIVVDNDENKSAEQIISNLNDNILPAFNLTYFSYPIKGIANIRNELIRRAFSTNSEYIILIDDDEFVMEQWLNELILTIISNEADAARGPVLAYKNEEISKYVWYWFKRERYPNNTKLTTLTTGNLILRRTSLEKYNIWFDQRFNFSGSEDGYFGIQLLKKGAKIYWAENAITYEVIPKSRGNLLWLTRRVYRTSSTFSYMLKLEHEYFKISKKIMVSILYLVTGTIATLAIFTKLKNKYWGILKMAEGMGGLMGVLNITYKEYKIK